jgi:putative transposase
MAVTRRRPPAGLVHHSDRGSQYTSLAFGRTLSESGLVASMGSRGDAYDNAACESCIATLKVASIRRHRYQSRDQARLSIFRYIETVYNPRRRHSSLGGISPYEYERRFQNRLQHQEIDTIETTRAALWCQPERGKLSGSPGRSA